MLLLIAILSVLFFCSPVFAAQSFYKLQNSLSKDFDSTRAAAQEEWTDYAISIHKDWFELKKEVEKKWGIFVYSSKKEWVQYDDKRDTKGSVNFEDGKIEIETIVLKEAENSFETIKKNLTDLLKKIFLKEYFRDAKVLEGQVLNKKGVPVTDENLDMYIIEDIVPNIHKKADSFQSKDGKERKKYSVSINLVPDHLNLRAKTYYNDVKKNAARFSLDPEFIMAIIHAESYFNPFAVSGKGAIGLMQIVPKWAGKETYEYLYGQGNLVPDYLYSPGVNIELGSAYLHLLATRYFAGIKDSEKIKQLSICAYNWGPGAINKNIVKKYNISKMSRARLYQVLINNTPEETSKYLQKVTEKEKVYQKYFL